jgi:uncharacterized membrane protein
MASSVYSVILEPETAELTVWAGETVTYTLWVENTGNSVDAINLERITPGWPTVISPSTLTIARGGRRTVQLAVTQPSDEAPGTEDVAVIRATGSGEYVESILTTAGGWRQYLPLVAQEVP